MRKKRYMFNVGVMLDEETYKRLTFITKEMKRPKSRFCRELLQDHLRIRREAPSK